MDYRKVRLIGRVYRLDPYYSFSFSNQILLIALNEYRMMDKYAIKHCHWNGLDYYTPQIEVTETRLKYWFYPYQYSYWQPMRGPLGYNRSLETAKKIIEDDILYKETKKSNYEEYLDYTP